MKKYEFTGETKAILGVTLHRIRAIADFGDVKAGDIGGWLESEDNLSQDDDAWVYGGARVCGDARVYGGALVYGDARVYGDALVYGDAQVYGYARVYGGALVYGGARVYGDARVYGYALVYGDAQVYGYARVYGGARVYGDAQVYGDARVYGDAHYLTVSPIGSRDDTLTFTRDKSGTIYASVGYFFGSISEFREKVRETHGESKHARAYLLAADLAEIRIDTTPIED